MKKKIPQKTGTVLVFRDETSGVTYGSLPKNLILCLQNEYPEDHGSDGLSQSAQKNAIKLQNNFPAAYSGPQIRRRLNIKVMVVDDEHKIADLYLIILRAAGFTVNCIAHDGLEAVHEISSNPEGSPDVILMDQKMPVMDGLEASKKIKELNPNIKIVMISAYDVPSSYKNLIDFVLAKPISKQILIDTIKNI